MPANDNRRQKKIEIKRAKRKEQQRTVSRVESSGVSGRTIAARNWTVFDTRVGGTIEIEGMGCATIARRGPHGEVVGVIFLLDMYCLGVKDLTPYFGSESGWKQRMEHLNSGEGGMYAESPEAVRKLVEGAVEYAKSFGIEPCREWASAAHIFGDIDSSQCLKEFTYGRDGKPTFIAGPNDGPARIQQILNILSENPGDGNFHFMIPAESLE